MEYILRKWIYNEDKNVYPLKKVMGPEWNLVEHHFEGKMVRYMSSVFPCV